MSSSYPHNHWASSPYSGHTNPQSTGYQYSQPGPDGVTVVDVGPEDDYEPYEPTPQQSQYYAPPSQPTSYAVHRSSASSYHFPQAQQYAPAVPSSSHIDSLASRVSQLSVSGTHNGAYFTLNDLRSEWHSIKRWQAQQAQPDTDKERREVRRALKRPGPTNHRLSEVAGIGGWSVVFKAVPASNRGHYNTVAAKCYFQMNLDRRLPQQSAVDEFNLGTRIKQLGGAAYVAQIVSTKPPSNSRPFTLLEYLDVSLNTIIKYSASTSRKLAPSLVHYLFQQIVRIVEWLHSRNILFTDLQPGNLMMGPDLKLKAVDFGALGIAGSKDRAYEINVEYAPPEFCDGGRPRPNFGTDSFNLGAVLQTMVCQFSLYKMTASSRAEGETHLSRRNFIAYYRPRQGVARKDLPAGTTFGNQYVVEKLWERYNDYGADCFNIMEGLLASDAAHRYTLARVMSSPYWHYGGKSQLLFDS
ncbi:hypothetical protein MNV49_007279 [Pseudohyphozyma bogoriensis]|nr:hypothetical protein MNV49_007279 [Pseudohyphozyma bogoriensis]